MARFSCAFSLGGEGTALNLCHLINISSWELSMFSTRVVFIIKEISLHSNTTISKGSNNFRWLQWYVSNFIRLVRQVVECINETPGAHLLLVSIIPSIENHDNNGPVFQLADDEMRKLANEHAKVSFLDLSKNFLRNRQLKPDFDDLQHKNI